MAVAASNLWELFEPVVTGMGYELIEIEYFPNPKHGVLRLYIDSEEGIQIDDCSDVSQQISALIDVEDPVPGKFNLEVSSPGLDRPLRRLKDFERFNGEMVSLKSRIALDGRRNFKGRLLGVDAEQVVVDCEGDEFRFPIDNIDKARLVP